MVDTVLCRLCSKPCGNLGTRCCDACWELESRVKANPALARRILNAMGTPERAELMDHADTLERAIMDLANGRIKPGKMPIEPMVRLIHYARTGTIRNATVEARDHAG